MTQGAGEQSVEVLDRVAGDEHRLRAPARAVERAPAARVDEAQRRRVDHNDVRGVQRGRVHGVDHWARRAGIELTVDLHHDDTV